MKHQDLHDEWMRDKAYAEEWRKREGGFKAGELLIGLRVRTGLTQQALAAASGVPQRYIARIEAGDANPTVGFVATVLRGVGYSLMLGVEPTDETGAPLGGEK